MEQVLKVEQAPIEQLNQIFNEAKGMRRLVKMPFVLAGFPDYETSLEIALQLVQAGADILEVGFPYSDPLADGPTIQRAGQIALQNGFTLEMGFRFMTDLRARGITTPLIAFTYVNPLLQYGIASFLEQLKHCGANAIIVPDLPFEEAGVVKQEAQEIGLGFISLIAPNSADRIKLIASQAECFIYCISSLGVTGVRGAFENSIEGYLQQVREASQVPLAVGFGISKPEHVQYFKDKVEGVIVASAFIHYILDNLASFQSSDTKVKEQSMVALRRFAQELFIEGSS